MTTGETLTLIRDRAAELRQQCEAKMSSIGVVSKAFETEEQLRIRTSAQSDFDTSDELHRLVAQIEGD